ncbi:MAG: Flp pilus assembly protein CpaB [Alphaproteobacteria bacterium]|nr:MAG: Flp pilus assembly protein CpaB [Alphaproteobacteria bacterium]
MPSARSLMLIVLALVFAGGAAWIARLAVVQREAAPAAAPQAVAPDRTGVRILVARRPLSFGHILGADDLVAQSWPDPAMNDAYIRVDEAGDTARYVGHVVRHALPAGAPIPKGALVAPGERGFLAAALTPGMRAVSVPVDAVTGVAGFIFPGDRVDVILNHRIVDPSGYEHFASETVVGNVRVLAIDTRTEAADGKAQPGRTVTLEVTPKIAERIALVQEMGSLMLSLRSLAHDGQEAAAGDQPLARTLSHTWDADVSRLLPPAEDPRRGVLVRVVRGDKPQVVDLSRKSRSAMSGRGS